jgi:hypothetical protein
MHGRALQLKHAAAAHHPLPLPAALKQCNLLPQCCPLLLAVATACSDSEVYDTEGRFVAQKVGVG